MGIPGRLALVLALSVMVACVFAYGQEDLHNLVSETVNNELHSQSGEHYWMFEDANSSARKHEITRVIETKECWLRWPLSIDSHPATAQEKKKAEERLQQLVNDSQAREKNRKEIDEDTKKANGVMQILPDAFLFRKTGQQGRTIQLAFRPNPKYEPSSNEGKVFHAMSGVLVIDMKEKRLRQISGQLTEDIDFGGGILGKIRKGGTFKVIQQELAPGDWEVTLLDVHVSGRALLFHTISEQQHETMTNFKPVPANIDLRQAAEIVRSGSQIAK